MPLRSRILAIAASLGLALGAAGAARAQSAAAGPVLSNTAHIAFRAGGTVQQVASNTVQLAVQPYAARSMHIMRLAEDGTPTATLDASGARCSGGAAGATSAPAPTGFDPSHVALRPAPSVHLGEPVFIDVQNADAVRDPTARETMEAVITSSDGDRESLSIEETAPGSGRFVGWIATRFAETPVVGDCHLSGERGDSLKVEVGDPLHPGAPLVAEAQVDPYGYVFKSSDGSLVDGARVTLVDDATGTPAHVLGDDGVSTYPSTVVSGRAVTDAAGAVYPYASGQYRFPKVAVGRYRLVIETPHGLTAPSAADPASLAKLASPLGGFKISDASYGRAFALNVATDLNADIPVDGQASGLSLDKTASATDASRGDFVQYRLSLQNRDATRPAGGVRIVDALPRGFRYVRGSARRNGALIADPDRGPDGRELTFAAGAIPAGGQSAVSYVLVLGDDAQLGEAVNRAQAFGNGGLSSNIAQATVRVRPAFYTDRIGIVGRVTEGDCAAPEGARQGVPGVRVLLQDGTFTVTDRDGLYHFEGTRPGLHVVQMDAESLPTGLQPRSCGQSTRRAGSDLSQFVDTQGGTLARADFQLRRTAAAVARPDAEPDVSDTRAAGDDIDWFSGARPGVAWLFPAPEHNPRAPAVRVAIAHLPAQHVDLAVNGAAVDGYAKEGVSLSADGTMAVSLWRGVPLHEGDNRLFARVTDARGALVAELNRRVHYANRPAHAAVVAARSILSADGMTRPVVAVRFTDLSGAPVRAGAMGTFRIAAPYAPAVDVADQQARRLNGQDLAATTWRVRGDDGVALIALAPTTHAGEAVLDLPLPGDAAAHPTRVRAWLKADRKTWVVVGFAAGTAGFATLSRHADPLLRTNGRPDFADGQLAFYATGRVKGEWLLTLAYDNKRTVDRERALQGGIDPDRDYTVYGDATGQGYDAPTQHKLYVRLERRAFYALFGDFETGFDATELGRYDRTLNGLKFERQGRTLSLAGFVADTDQTHVRDEIQGSGISGPYQLSRHDIVEGSEQLRIETRDATRSDRVLSTQPLQRHVDYDIDDLTGALSFARPVLSRDAALNPNIIVAEYEVASGAKSMVAGGRAAARLAGGRVTAGVTYLHDGQGTHDAATNLVAADLKLRPRADTEIRLEAAVSDRDALGAPHSQTAYIAEVEHRSDRAEVLGYVRQQDLGFGVGQQAFSEAGAQKVGLDGKLRLTPTLSLQGSGYHERYMATGATRDAVDARLDYTRGDWALNLGLKVVQDQTIAAGQADSRLLTLGAIRYLLNHKLQLTGSTDVSLDGKAQSLDFPVRRRFGAAYSFTDTLRVSVSHETAEGAKFQTQTTAATVDFAPWRGAKVTTGLGDQTLAQPEGAASAAPTASGPHTYAQFGLAQSLLTTKRWTVDASLDTSSTLSGHVPTSALTNPAFPSAAGGTTYASGLGQAGAAGGTGVVVEDFRAVSLGAAYRSPLWTWTGRAEARFGAAADTWSVSTAYLRQLKSGVTALAGLRASDTSTPDGARSALTSLEGSLAWRPLDSRWSVLDRLELRFEDSRGTGANQTLAGFGALASTDADSGRVVNNFVVNYDSDTRHGAGGVQASLYYGAKYVRGRFADDVYTGFVDAVAVQARYNLTDRIDIGVAGAVEHAWAAKTASFSVGPSLGVSPAANTWISVGWNVVGFRDRDFEANAYTRTGPYVTARLKFDQASLGGFRRLLRAGG